MPVHYPPDCKETNPDDYPHRLTWEGNHVYLVTRRKEGEDERRDLGTSSAVHDAYIRWKHLKTDHSQAEANVFLWGVMTGMSVALWEEIERLVRHT